MAPSGRIGTKPTLRDRRGPGGDRSRSCRSCSELAEGRATSREAVMRAVAEPGTGRRSGQAAGRAPVPPVGVLLNDLRQPWFADMLDGLTPALQAGGKRILLGDGGSTDDGGDLNLVVPGSRCRRLVLAGSVPVSATISTSPASPDRRGGRPWPGLDLPHVDVLANDDRLGGELAVRTYNLGHTRIAHISGLPSSAGNLRVQGYEGTMRASASAANPDRDRGSGRGRRLPRRGPAAQPSRPANRHLHR